MLIKWKQRRPQIVMLSLQSTLCVHSVVHSGPILSQYLKDPLWGIYLIHCLHVIQGVHRTNAFSCQIQIHWKIDVSVNSFPMIGSLQIFAHAMTAVLSWHVQNFVVITSYKNVYEKRVGFPLNSTFLGKIVSTVDPWTCCTWLPSDSIYMISATIVVDIGLTICHHHAII